MVMAYFTEAQFESKINGTFPDEMPYIVIAPLADAWAIWKAPNGSETQLAELAMAYTYEYYLKVEDPSYVINLESQTIKSLLPQRWFVEI